MKKTMSKVSYYGFRITVLMVTLFIDSLFVAMFVRLGMDKVRWYDPTDYVSYIIAALFVGIFIIGQLKLLVNVLHQITERIRTKKLHNNIHYQEMIIRNGGTINHEGNVYPFSSEI